MSKQIAKRPASSAKERWEAVERAVLTFLAGFALGLVFGSALGAWGAWSLLRLLSGGG